MNKGAGDQHRSRWRDCYRNCKLRIRLEMRDKQTDDDAAWIGSYKQVVGESAFFCAAPRRIFPNRVTASPTPLRYVAPPGSRSCISTRGSCDRTPGISKARGSPILQIFNPAVNRQFSLSNRTESKRQACPASHAECLPVRKVSQDGTRSSSSCQGKQITPSSGTASGAQHTLPAEAFFNRGVVAESARGFEK